MLFILIGAAFATGISIRKDESGEGNIGRWKWNMDICTR